MFCLSTYASDTSECMNRILNNLGDLSLRNYKNPQVHMRLESPLAACCVVPNDCPLLVCLKGFS